MTMRKAIKSLILCIALLAAAFSLFSCRSLKDQFIPETETYEISIKDEIKVYLGQSYKLSPNLTDKDGNTVESRFTYESSSDKVSITSAGEVLINEIPTEEIYVTIYEKNTSTTKRVKLSVITALTEVHGVLNGDGELPISEQSAVYNHSIAFAVVTKPREIEIEEYCEVKILSDGGEKTNAFTVSFEDNIIYLKATGLGKGKIVLDFSDGEKHFGTSEIPFEISMLDKALSDAILENEASALLSADELCEIETIIIDSDVKDISECSNFASIDTVVITSDAVPNLIGADEKYCYRVKGAILRAFLTDGKWSELFDRIIPYNVSYTERAVVYRSERSTDLSYRIVDDEFELDVLSFAGYVNTGWKNASGELVDAEDISVIEKNGIHLFADWTPNINSVVFNSNDALGEMEPQKMATDATEKLKPCKFTKRGYTFLGWSTEKNGAVIYGDQALYTMGAGEVYTLYAVWASNNNTLEFSANGGMGSMESISLPTDETTALPALSYRRAGYVFLGWSEAPDGNAVYEDQALYTMGAASKYTLYAVWEPIVNRLTFDSNNGTGDTVVMNKATDSEFNLPENSFTLSGYTFLGWSVEPNGTVEYTDTELYTMTAERESVLYAVWEASINKIVFNANGGTGSMEPQMLRTHESANLSECTFERNGYTFIGWSTTLIGSPVYENTAMYRMGTLPEYNLYAVWMSNENTLAFSANGGSGDMEHIEAETDAHFVLPENKFVRAGYTFAGWSTTPAGAVEYEDSAAYTMGGSASAVLYAVWQANTNKLTLNANNDGENSDTKIISKKTDEVFELPENEFVIPGYTFMGWSYKFDGSVNFTDKESFRMPADEIVVLYAVWQANTNEIVFSANTDGAVGEMENQQIKTDELEKLTKCRFKKAGYTFLGWSTTPDGTVEFADGAEYLMTAEKTRTLYAVWSKNTYSVSYVLNGGINSSDAVYAYDVETETIVLSVPTRAGYTFGGWYSDAEMKKSVTAIEKGSFGDVVLYAKWTVKTNRLYLNSNGGVGSLEFVEMATDSTGYIPAASTFISRNGYIFRGWSTSLGGEVVYSDNSSYTMGTDSSYTLYAVWERETYTIRYELDKGTNSSNPSSYHVESDDILLRDPIKAGFTFEGWYTDPSMTSGRIEKIEKGSYGNIVIYAKWSANTYNVIFNSNGGQGTMASIPMKSGEIKNLPSNIFYREDSLKTFVGWALTPNGSLVYTNGETFRMESSDVTLYALWSSNTYSITYVLDGGVNHEANVHTYNSNNDEIPLYDPTKIGSDFEGWYTNSAMTNRVTSIPANADPQLTLYAKWNPIEYVITAGDEQYVKHYGDEYQIPDLIKTGYRFNGWFHNGNLVNKTDLMLMTEDHELTPDWSIIDYTVSYSMGNWQMIGNSYPTSFTINDSISISSPTYKYYPEYNEFDGWYLDSDFTVPFKESEVLANPRNITLYPKSVKPLTEVYTTIESTPDLTGKRVIVDWSGVTTLNLSSYSRTATAGSVNNNVIQIHNTVEEVIFIGNAGKVFENLGISLVDFASTATFKLGLVNFKFRSHLNGAIQPKNSSTGVTINVNVTGDCFIESTASGGAVFSNNTKMFTGDINFSGIGSIKLKAGNGTGKNNGGVAIYARYITLTPYVSVTAIGGNGANGANGSRGKDHSFWSATSGTDGSDGTAGGHAIVLSGIINDSLLGYANNLAAIGGNGGDGGIGGDGGNNRGWFSTGASGGNGGNGGAGGAGIIDSLGARAYTAGSGGDGGDGGFGGSGRSHNGSSGTGGDGAVNGYGVSKPVNANSGRLGGEGTP